MMTKMSDSDDHVIVVAACGGQHPRIDQRNPRLRGAASPSPSPDRRRKRPDIPNQQCPQTPERAILGAADHRGPAPRNRHIVR